jgi:hypothetical protein
MPTVMSMAVGIFNDGWLALGWRMAGDARPAMMDWVRIFYNG